MPMPLSPHAVSDRFAASALASDSAVTPNSEVDTWLAGHQNNTDHRVRLVPFNELTGWRFAADTGNLVHESGRFFAVTGLRARTNTKFGPNWTQPILYQPEVGLLGIAIRDFDGVPHCLMQAKMEPGNVNAVQLAPTVQATASNYGNVHNGRGVSLIGHFTQPKRILVDALQSEPGAWFLHKRNRNMVVEVTEEIPEHPDFRWLTIGQIYRLLRHDNAVNMSTRSVLACIPMTDPAPSSETAAAVVRYLTEIKSHNDIIREQIPLAAVRGWTRSADRITHDGGRHFSIVGAAISSASRETRQWSQPLLAPVGRGVVAFLMRDHDGEPQVLAQARVEPGLPDIVEFGPTVQCVPGDHDVPTAFLDRVLAAPADRVRYRAALSEEGSRFHAAENDYLLVDVGDDAPSTVPPGFTWLNLRTVSELLRYGYFFNMQARTLFTIARAINGVS